MKTFFPNPWRPVRPQDREGIAFWCNNHACQQHDSTPEGRYGGGLQVAGNATGHRALQLLHEVLWPGAGQARVEGDVEKLHWTKEW